MHYAIIGFITLVLVAVAPAVYNQPEPEHNAQTIQVQEAPQKATKHITKKAKTVKKVEKSVNWKDNPNNCNQKTQYIRADNLKCIDKPKIPQTTVIGSCATYRHLIAKYDWNVETMMYAMSKESGCNPNAVGDNYPINGLYAPSCGLLQVRTLPGRPSCEQLKNPSVNVATAYQIWKSQGYRAWSVLH